MGFWSYLRDLEQDSRIQNLNDDAEDAAMETETLRSKVAKLQTDNVKLKCTLSVILEELEVRCGASLEDIETRANSLFMERAQVKNTDHCSSCGRKLNKALRVCVYCGPNVDL